VFRFERPRAKRPDRGVPTIPATSAGTTTCTKRRRRRRCAVRLPVINLRRAQSERKDRGPVAAARAGGRMFHGKSGRG